MDISNTGCHGVTQRIMSTLAEVDASTISKRLQNFGMEPIDSSVRKQRKYCIEDVRKILQSYFPGRYTVVKKMQSFFNFKGGVGKTSICFQVGCHLALCGYKVLLIDLDSQAHLSASLGIPISDAYLTFYDACVGNAKIQDVIQNLYEGLDCIPSNFSLNRAELDITEGSVAGAFLENIFEPVIDKYDFILFDMNATLSYMNVRVLSQCDVVNIVTETQAYGVQSANAVVQNVRQSCLDRNIKCPEMLMIPNKYEDRSAVSCEAMYILRKEYSDYLIPDFVIRKSEDFNTSNKNSLPLAFFCRSNSIAFEDIVELIKRIVRSSSKAK